MRRPARALATLGLALALGCAGPAAPPTTVVVTATWRGADALSVERSLLEPLEHALSTVPGVQRVDGRADAGIAEIELTMATDDLAAVRDALPLTALPAEADPPVVVRREPGVQWLSVAPEKAESVALEIERTPEVSEVVRHGVAERRIEVKADPSRLLAYGLDVTTLIAGLRACNVQVPAGRIGGAPDPLAQCPIGDARVGNLATIEATPGEITALGPEGRVAVLEVRTRLDRVAHLEAVPLDQPVRARPADLQSLRSAFPRAIVVVDGDDALIWGDVSGAPAGIELWRPTGEVHEVVVTGPDLDEVAAQVGILRAEIGRATWTDLPPERPEIDFLVDREEAAALGLQASAVTDALAVLEGGLRVGRADDADVWLVLEGARPEDVGAVVLRTRDGAYVPLSDLVTVTLGARRAILHKDGQRGASILVDGEVPDLSGVRIPAGMAITVR